MVLGPGNLYPSVMVMSISKECVESRISWLLCRQ